MRLTPLLALSALLVLHCGDAQLDEWDTDGRLVVVPTQWSTRHAPGIDVATAFPDLPSAERPTFESSDPRVIEVRLLTQQIDEPRFRAARLRTHTPGEAEIRLYDDGQLIRTEPVRVEVPTALSFDILEPTSMPDFARDPSIPLALLRLGQAEARASFVNDMGDSVVAAGFIVFSRGIDLLGDDRGSVSFWDRDVGLYFGSGAVDGQLRPNNVVRVSGPHMGMAVALPDEPRTAPRVSGDVRPLEPGQVATLEVLTDYDPAGPGLRVVVFGRTGESPDRRVMGLQPVITVDGDASVVEPEPSYPWIAHVETATGTLEVRWRGFFESIVLDSNEG